MFMLNIFEKKYVESVFISKFIFYIFLIFYIFKYKLKFETMLLNFLKDNVHTRRTINRKAKSLNIPIQ